MNYLREIQTLTEQTDKSTLEIAQSLALYYRTIPRNIIRDQVHLIDAINKWYSELGSTPDSSVELIITYCNVLYYRVLGDYEKLFRRGLKPLKNGFSKSDYTYLGWIHRLISAASFALGLIDQSVEHALKAVDYFDQLANIPELNRSYIQLGIAYDYTENYRLQLEYFQKSYDLSTQIDTQKMALNNIIYVHILRKEYDLARTKLIHLKDKIPQDETSLVNVAMNLNAMRIALYDQDIEALNNLYESIQTLKLLDTDQSLKMDSYLLFSRKELMDNNYDEAKKILENGFKMAQTLGSKKYQLLFLEDMVKVDLKENNYRHAFELQERFINLTKVIDHEKAGYQYLFLRVQYEIDQINREVMKLKHQLDETQESTIYTLAALAEYKDQITGKHILRTIAYVECFCKLLNERYYTNKPMTQDYIDNFSRSAALHDIGKVGVSDQILKKPGKLTLEEFSQMKKHTSLGKEALSITKKIMGRGSFLKLAEIIAYTHHEKWDGSGYPEGLTGDRIPFEGRIVAIIDVYDALISRRPYKPPYSHLKAVAILEEGRGTHFDPRLIDVFLKNHQLFYDIAKRLLDSEDEKEVLSSNVL